jgi:protein involved in polysaccharide export with SLBB domain
MASRIVTVGIAVLLAIVPAIAAASPLRAGDRVAVTVFNHPELAVLAGTIDADGDLAMPIVGNVAIAGAEPDAAADRIGSAMQKYLRKPVVQLNVLQQNATISIVGGPNSSLPYVPGQTLSSVASSMLATPGLDFTHVTVDRDGKRLGQYDTADLLRKADPGPALQPGDRVAFAQKPVGVNVAGVVKTPGMVYLNAGATVADAVYAAGGVTSDAAIGALDLLRNGQHQHLALSSDAAQTPALVGDVVTVPQALHVSVTGKVARPGDTALINGTTLYAALYQAGGPVQYGDMSHTEVVHDGIRHVYDVTKIPSGDAAQNPHLVEGDVVYVPTGHHVNLGDIFGAITSSRAFFF